MNNIENIEKELIDLKNIIKNENIENNIKEELLKKIKKIIFDVKVVKEIQEENYHMHIFTNNHHNLKKNPFNLIKTLSKTKLSDFFGDNIQNNSLNENNENNDNDNISLISNVDTDFDNGNIVIDNNDNNNSE